LLPQKRDLKLLKRSKKPNPNVSLDDQGGTKPGALVVRQRKEINADLEKPATSYGEKY